MKFVLHPWQLLLLILAGWINRQEQDVIEYLFFGEKSLQNAVSNFLAHYHKERNHQGLNNQLLQPGAEAGCTAGDVVCRERLGEMLRYYYRQAA
jgi:hypothetical protein